MEKFIPKIGVLVTFVFLLSSFTLVQASFPDVDTQDSSAQFIDDLNSRGIVKGYSDGSFKPDNLVTRAELAKFIVLAFNLDQTDIGNDFTNFPDVDENHNLIRYINILKKLEVVGGFSDGTFRPDDNVTKGQLMKYAVLAGNIKSKMFTIKEDSQVFSDVPASNPLFKYVNTITNHKLIDGQELIDNTKGSDFDIEHKVTRREMAKFISLVLDFVEGTSSNQSFIYYPVTKVVDGDTIEVNINGTTEKIRLIGIDTPETVDPRKPVQCFGIEASNKAKELLSGKSIGLEADQSQGERDKYDRLLRYVFLQNGTNFNKYMISEGYAFEYTYNTAYKYQAEFKEAQKQATSAKKGLWADNACTTPTATPIPVGAIPSDDEYTCNCSKTCTQMSSCDEAYYQLDTCGCSKRDGDNDGIPCEDLCN
ncbi:S-layer homology domain-containing protein [Candidatus Dojkabacteria bacterium]|nr:S-layer homology domain-containing protein [Candidatus Dojkabacteria bacterium]